MSSVEALIDPFPSPTRMTNDQTTETWESSPSGMMEYYQHQKYNLGQSIADLIDNCYDHGATKIRVDLNQINGELFLRILDDGFGMNNDELTNAMGLGVRKKDRPVEDLGIFGIGMKLSSLAQANQVTVCSLKDDDFSLRRIDADHIREKDENILKRTSTNSEVFLESQRIFIEENWSTMVLLEDLHGKKRFHSYDRELDDSISKEIKKIRIHLGLTFQKIIRDKPEVELLFNGKIVESIDPMMYYEKDPIFGTESQQIWIKLDINGSPLMVKVIFVIIPHSNCCANKKLYKKTNSGYSKANDMQGLYIYRNNRLIDYGGWHGLFSTRDEHSKLAKIEVHLPPSANKYFGLNPTKTDLHLPSEFMRLLHKENEGKRKWGDIGSSKKMPFSIAADHRYRNDGKKKKKMERENKTVKKVISNSGDPNKNIGSKISEASPKEVRPIPQRTKPTKPRAVISEINSDDPRNTIVVLDKSKEGYDDLMNILREWEWD
jgi:hypothetical protein